MKVLIVLAVGAAMADKLVLGSRTTQSTYAARLMCWVGSKGLAVRVEFIMPSLVALEVELSTSLRKIYY
jgi:hypothetical protein